MVFEIFFSKLYRLAQNNERDNKEQDDIVDGTKFDRVPLGVKSKQGSGYNIDFDNFHGLEPVKQTQSNKSLPQHTNALSAAKIGQNDTSSSLKDPLL